MKKYLFAVVAILAFLAPSLSGSQEPVGERRILLTERGSFPFPSTNAREELLLLEARGWGSVRKGDLREALGIYRKAAVLADSEVRPYDFYLPSGVVNVYYYLALLTWIVERKDAEAENYLHKAIELASRTEWPELPGLAGKGQFLTEATTVQALMLADRRDFRRSSEALISALRIYDYDMTRASVLRQSRSEEPPRATALAGVWLAVELAFRKEFDPSVAYEVSLRAKGRASNDLSARLMALKKRDQLGAVSEYLSISSQYELHPQTFSREALSRFPNKLRDSQTANLFRADPTKSTEFWQSFKAERLEELNQRLPENAVLLDFVVYRRHRAGLTGDGWEEPRYAAFVSRHSVSTRAVDLGPVSTIDEQIELLREELADAVIPISEVRQAGRSLYMQLLDPLRDSINEGQLLIICPDGLLQQLPFAALVDARGRFLVEAHPLTYVQSANEVISPSGGAAAAQSSSPVVIGLPNFGPRSLGPPRPESTAGLLSRLGDLRAIAPELVAAEQLREKFLNFDPSAITSTANEARAVAASLGVQALVDDAATEDFVKGLHSPSILHIATHAFHIPVDVSVPAPDFLARKIDFSKRSVGVAKLSPMVRSGLALAGANVLSDGTLQDGLLTAEELALVDLVGTELVVLSACNTGLGDASVGNGIFGLLRALRIAGSRSQVVSLWSVNDRSTEVLMVDFYAKFQGGLPSIEALRQSQISMINKDVHPYFWAGLIHSGAWERANYRHPVNSDLMGVPKR